MEIYFVQGLVERVNIKLFILPQLIYRFNTVSIKMTAGIFVDFDKLTLKFIWKSKGHRIAKIL